MRRLSLGVLSVAATLVAVTACGSDDSTGSGSGNSAGGTIKVGLITSLSGPLAAQFAGVDKDFKARIEVENAKGGVGGRQIEVVVVDDVGTVQGNLTAAQKLVESENVVAVADESAFVSGAIRYLHDKNIPVFGGLYSGPFWGQEPYTNMFGSWGSTDPDAAPFTTVGLYLKSIGATRVGSVGFGNSPSSKVNAENQAVSAEAAGLVASYVDVNAQIGNNDFSSQALGLKNAGVDTLYTSLGGPQSVALLTAARQTGAPIEYGLFNSGYSPSVIGSPAEQTLQGIDFSIYYAPQQADTPATQAVVAALKQYAGLADDSFYSFDIMGWLSASLIVEGLEAAGPDPTSASIIEKLRTVSGYDADGLLPAKVDFSKFGSGTTAGLGANGCVYIVRLTGAEFELQADGKPVCGEPVGN